MKKVYACYLKDELELRNSSSGGAFTALSNAIFELNGSVIACKYNYGLHKLEFSLASNLDERNLMRGSKYIQADVHQLYKLVYEELQKGTLGPLLVVGTPCQIAGLKTWLNVKKLKHNRKIVLCDLICHGVSSPQMWMDYMHLVEDENKKKVKNVTFKDKSEYGWIRPFAKVIFDDDSEKAIEEYVYFYKSNNFMRDSCYSCKYSDSKRISDITIGDFWKIDELDSKFKNKQGNSCVIINSSDGQELFDLASKWLLYILCNNDSYKQDNLQFSTKKGKSFWIMHKVYEKKGIKYLIDELFYFNSRLSVISKVKRKIYRLIYED